MGHLDKLAEDMAAKGLSVIAVTKQSRAAVDTFLEETGAKHPIVIEKTDSMRNYGSSSYPTSFLIGTNGRILWRGHPGNLSDSTLEEQLAGAKILPDFPKELAAARKFLEKDKYAEAQKKVAKVLEEAKLEGEDKAAAESIAAWFVWYADSTLEGAAKDTAAGNVYGAFLAYEHIADAYKGAEVGTRAKDLAKQLEADKDHKNEIKAGEKLAKIKAELGDLTPKKAIKALEPLTAKKYAETKAGKEAAELIAQYEKATE